MWAFTPGLTRVPHCGCPPAACSSVRRMAGRGGEPLVAHMHAWRHQPRAAAHTGNQPTEQAHTRNQPGPASQGDQWLAQEAHLGTGRGWTQCPSGWPQTQWCRPGAAATGRHTRSWLQAHRGEGGGGRNGQLSAAGQGEGVTLRASARAPICRSRSTCRACLDSPPFSPMVAMNLTARRRLRRTSVCPAGGGGQIRAYTA